VNTQIGFCEVYALRIAKKEEKMFAMPISGTENESKQIKGEFNVNKWQSNYDLFEIRVYFLGDNELTLKNLTLVKD
jgi:hypothetical protein